MKYLYWALLWPLVFTVGQIARILSPIACLFVTRSPYTTTVKRMGKQIVTLERDRLVWWLTWLDTDDNATVEFWYGAYGYENVTQSYYDNSAWLRYKCRVKWLNRNSAYTFNRKFFGLDKDSPLAWKYKGNSFIKGRTINIGWKAHKGITRLMYAGRIL